MNTFMALVTPVFCTNNILAIRLFVIRDLFNILLCKFHNRVHTVEPASTVTSLIQPHPAGPKQPQCIYYGMQPG